MKLKRKHFLVMNWVKMSAGSERSTEKRAEADQNMSEELQSRPEADRTWLQLMYCTLMHTAFYFG